MPRPAGLCRQARPGQAQASSRPLTDAFLGQVGEGSDRLTRPVAASPSRRCRQRLPLRLPHPRHAYDECTHTTNSQIHKFTTYISRHLHHTFLSFLCPRIASPGTRHRDQDIYDLLRRTRPASWLLLACPFEPLSAFRPSSLPRFATANIWDLISTTASRALPAFLF